MQTEKQRERLVELIKNAKNDKNLCWYDLYDLCSEDGCCAEYFADYLIANNVVVLPCVAYNKSHERYQVIHKGKDGRIFASKLYHTRKDAENVLKERNNAD